MKLERLQLNNVPNISGQVSALANLPNIQGVGLANTSVKGDLMTLAGLRTLRGLRLDGSQVNFGTSWRLGLLVSPFFSLVFALG